MSNSTVEKYFARGQYSQIIDSYLDNNPPKQLSHLDLAFAIGALVFVGRRDDAQLYYRRSKLRHDLEAGIIARFFLGIGATRDSDYDAARGLFTENLGKLAATKKQKSQKSLFYIFQGLGFYRNFCCRYQKSLLWANKARQAALDCTYEYGQLLAADLRGHNLVQLGQLSLGLKILKEAQKIAITLKAHSVSEAIDISIVNYQGQHFYNKTNYQHMLKKLAHIRAEDTYSRTNLKLEITRALIVAGEADQAREMLATTTEDVYRYGHRRQKATLHFRQGYLHYLAGDYKQALETLKQGLKFLQPDIDLIHLIELTGLQVRIYEELAQQKTLPDTSPSTITIPIPIASPSKLQKLQQTVASASKSSGRAISLRILGRQHKVQHIHDDPLGNLMDALQNRSIEAMNKALSEKCPGLLTRWLHGRRATKSPNLYAYLDLAPNKVLMFDRGEFHLSSENLTPTLKRLLILLSRGPCSKQDLVELVWNYGYSPLRHDSMLYTALHRLRQLLGRFGEMLGQSEGTYYWLRPCTLTIMEPQLLTRVLRDDMQILSQLPTRDLNLRQTRIYETLNHEAVLTCALVAKLFKIPKITASRDLSILERRGLITKIGKGRAISYLPALSN